MKNPETHVALELTVHSRRRARRARRAVKSGAGVLVLGVLGLALPPAFGLNRHTVTDDAMSGDMSRGAVVFTESTPVADLEVGDVITYPHPARTGREALITRRIAAIAGGLIWTRSDRTGEVDPWTITQAQAKRARAVVEVPYTGYVYDAVANGSRELWRTVTER